MWSGPDAAVAPASGRVNPSGDEGRCPVERMWLGGEAEREAGGGDLLSSGGKAEADFDFLFPFPGLRMSQGLFDALTSTSLVALSLPFRLLRSSLWA